jgi:hypothetical protein
VLELTTDRRNAKAPCRQCNGQGWKKHQCLCAESSSKAGRSNFGVSNDTSHGRGGYNTPKKRDISAPPAKK